jgi:pimeloyl-ACP methyl ester carboxylesterase
MQLRDGRRLAWVEIGDPSRRPVVVAHGLPGSREQRHPDEGIACAARVRLVHVDRPGFGRSDPAPARRLRDWPGDIQQLADHLGLERFAVAGVSGGGPFAAACAALLPERVSRLLLVSSVGPPGSMAPPASVRLGFALAQRAPAVLIPLLAIAARLIVARPQAYLSLLARRLGGNDRLVLSRPEIRAMLARDVREAFRQGVGAFVHDLALVASAWNLPFDRIRAQCFLWHGRSDRIIPPSASEHLARLIPGSRLRVLPGEGHFFVFDRWAELLQLAVED